MVEKCKLFIPNGTSNGITHQNFDVISAVKKELE